MLGARSSVLEGGAFSWAPLDSASLQIHGIDPRQSCFVCRVRRETAPGPVLRVPHEPSHHRIRVHVLQFFLFLLVTVHVELDLPPSSARGIMRHTNEKTVFEGICSNELERLVLRFVLVE